MRVGGEVQEHGGQRVLVDAERDLGSGRSWRRQLGGRQDVREHPHRRCPTAFPGGGDPGGQRADRLRQPGRGGLAVDPGYRGQEVQPVPGQAAARRARRDVPGRGAADLGLVRVAEAQLEARPEQVADGRPELRPLVGRGHQVDAVTEAPGRQRGDGLLELFIILAQGEPAVHDEEHVAEPVARDRALGPKGPVGGDRVDAALAELAFPPLEQGPDLGDRTAHPVSLEPGRDPAHVRQPAERAHRAAAEIQDVELHPGGGVQQSQRADQGEQDGRLAAPRPAGHGHVAGAAGQVGPERVPALLEGPVHDPEQGQQHLPLIQLRQQLAEGGRSAERRQPDLVRRRAL